MLLFSRARSGLKPDGLIFVKENIWWVQGPEMASWMHSMKLWYGEVCCTARPLTAVLVADIPPAPTLAACAHVFTHAVVALLCALPRSKKGFVVDKDDSSLTRSNTYMLDLFEKAGMQVGGGTLSGDVGLQRVWLDLPLQNALLPPMPLPADTAAVQHEAAQLPQGAVRGPDVLPQAKVGSTCGHSVTI